LSLDWWLNFWTILVVVGVAVELLVLITEYTHDWREFSRGIIHSPGKPSLVVFGLGFLGAGMVAIGVAGEFRIHIKAGRIETDMRDATRKLVGLVEGEAARLTSENLKLREKMADRHLSEGQRGTVAAKLRRFSGQRIFVMPYSGNGEAVGVANDIMLTLGQQGAGWDADLAQAQEMSRAVSGILVEIRDNARESDRAAANALVSALRAERLDISGPLPAEEVTTLMNVRPENRRNPPDPIKMTIGRKP
jgi:hypothetical protein